ncbi:aromatic ring-hydroxylating oxygenase subunit alpha [Frigidibacter sp. ROC022]|uniref:aromatic ring-hydroxylating oxygenase subunit alpha n=1 Tax=Frigidibacter sp. ROC022 TaxID=2971796 RepID=UPI00215B6901|nr:SRPBCC family protein [Frigidibacter sp. ROC022]MCR8725055.1 Rieske 2Fe-2S domain-containing protein [Frigidibacter sp. ROC022]
MALQDLSDVLTPLAAARGLPNAHYTDDATFALERRRLLFDNWSGIGFAKDIPEPGDARPIEFLGIPLLALRTRAGAVKVFQNTCRHRGMILVESPKKLGGVIRCPYHSWCYSLEGRLVTTPHVGGPGRNTAPGIERDGLGLIEIRSHVWRDVIFVNVTGTAPEFARHAAEAIRRWSDFEGKPLYHAGADSSFAFDAACNWKLAVENYCESYHLPWVHPGLNSYSRLEDHYHIEEPGCFSGQGTSVYRQLAGEGARRFPDFDGLSGRWDTAAEYVALYPNVLFGTHRDHAFAIILDPVAKDRTVERVELYYAQPEALEPEFAALRARNAELWKNVFAEDIFVVEGMQKGRRGPYFDGGRFSPAMDGPTHLFHKWVASRLTEGDMTDAR